jgi:hypothetical protein
MELSSAREFAIVAGIVLVIFLLLILLKETIVGSSRAHGLGVTRAQVQTFFERPFMGFTVTSTATVNGVQIVSMMAPAGAIAEVKLVGPKRELTRASLAVGLSRQDNSITAKSAIYLNGFVLIVAGDWGEGEEWVRDNLHRALTTALVSTTLTNPDRTVSLRVQPDAGSVMLSIEADVAKRRSATAVDAAETARSLRGGTSLLSQRAVRSTPLAS